MRRLLTLLIVVALVGGAGAWYWRHGQAPAASYRTAPVQRGDLRITISATGTVEPEEVVDIGAQVAGQIINLGPDPRDSSKTVDYGTAVEEGTVLARIDDALYASDVDQASASLEVAKANEQRSEADLLQLKARYTQADRDLHRAQELQRNGGGAIAAQDFDQYQANYDTSKANVAVGEASIVQAKKAVAQAEAALKKAQKNLSYCTIQSPVKGVIVDRRVNVGQTVVSSLNAPSLFLIAKDLKRLQVWVSVNEADIGQIRAGQPVTFTVDAYPKDVFKGTVNKVRLNATMTQNVVTYTVEVTTDNSDGKLLPYLTANVLFEVGQHQNVLLVPNAALRWRPQPQQIAPDVREKMAAKGGKRKDKAGGDAEAPKEATERGTLWEKDGEFVRPLHVHVGWSDGTQTEVEGDRLAEGAEVVVGEVRQNGGENTSNPFAPKMFGGSGGKSSQ
jgi:HlyD family secretion protein